MGFLAVIIIPEKCYIMFGTVIKTCEYIVLGSNLTAVEEGGAGQRIKGGGPMWMLRPCLVVCGRRMTISRMM
jgi:hypothetical protein